mmetsp:Transcript_33224/g.109852  ORF Transcript_33224/g.109852 Transcript_33224/m.109852 type:complete len:241 (+) Transcript_33224:251-973(+)
MPRGSCGTTSRTYAAHPCVYASSQPSRARCSCRAARSSSCDRKPSPSRSYSAHRKRNCSSSVSASYGGTPAACYTSCLLGTRAGEVAKGGRGEAASKLRKTSHSSKLSPPAPPSPSLSSTRSFAAASSSTSDQVACCTSGATCRSTVALARPSRSVYSPAAASTNSRHSSSTCAGGRCHRLARSSSVRRGVGISSPAPRATPAMQHCSSAGPERFCHGDACRSRRRCSACTCARCACMAW